MATIKIKRGTAAQLDAAALAGNLLAGEPYYVQDANAFAIGKSAHEYVLLSSRRSVDGGDAASIDYELVEGLGVARWGSITGALSDQSDIVAALAGKFDLPTRKTALVLETDFYAATSPFAQGLVGSATSSGTMNTTNGTPDHPGVVYLRDSTTANGGYRISTAATAFRLGGGEKCVVTFQPKGFRTTATMRMGFDDSTNQTDPVDGVFVKLIGNGTNGYTVTGYARNNNAQTATGSTFTAVANTWYTLIVELNADATVATFTLETDAGATVWTDTVGSNIPKTAGRETAFQIIVFESTTDAAADIVWVDYCRVEINRMLTR